MVQTKEEAAALINRQKEFFHTGKTKEISFRKKQLLKLKQVIVENEQEILDALYKDLRKSEFEAYATEVGFTLDSIKNMLKNMDQWAKPVKVKTPVHQMPSKSWIAPEPYGSVLIVGPFNYPFQLVIEPLIGAMAAGNCAIIKPSENTPHTSALIKRMLNETFDPEYILAVEGEKETTSAFIHSPFDYIFFTGSVPIGKVVMKAAAENLVPVTLELGGKSPAIIDRTADLDLAAKRIVWGKLVNAGQTCVAPDYLLVHQNVKDVFVEKLKQTIFDFYGSDPKESPDFGRIVNERQFNRLRDIIRKDHEKVIFGGETDKEDLYVSPTLLEADWSDSSMEDEIFGPILPIISYQELHEVIRKVNERPKPLALYVFTESKAIEEKVLQSISFGGGCVNDTVSHVGSPYLPFGGVGPSGMNAYHGKFSFDTFSHHKSILKKSTRFSVDLIFPPYGDKVNVIRKFLK
ncbi:aldehyde dehydrogenase (NAD+) [Bacillus ectoiniformans]|uniref:aldehyde dehydrogenase n=1 Tax=Bacillus ectoiniformans TaxID=1494429 RepID=UPI0019590A14|nr:aldehyde dehydrogenase [Bacillus ectoiniformans]MBM7649210.1 aldehyde dehydrogenase (NAD+) [Bacillus ectoiniformans]